MVFDPAVSLAKARALGRSLPHDLAWSHERWGGRFAERHPLNCPGPFYAADTDTCCCGAAMAPSMVLHDEVGMEVVWRQPSDEVEVLALAAAAWQDPFAGHACDGDDHWTPALVRSWWHELPKQADRLARAISTPECTADPALDARAARCRQQWGRYVGSSEQAQDLRRYLYRLQEGRWPGAADLLPRL